MLTKITEDEVKIMECLCYPISALECLFSDFDNYLLEDEKQLAHIRLYQYLLLSYEYLIDELELDPIPKINQQLNFKLRENVGTIDCFGGRGFGKTVFVEILDIFLSLIHQDGDDIGFSSFDALHIRGVLEKLIEVFENHSFFKIFKVKINRSPNYKFSCPTGWNLNSVNANNASRNPGQSFFQRHFKKLYIEEASKEIEEVFNKRLGSVSELGCVIRSAGMTDFTKYSPAGRRFYDIKNKKFVCNLPQFVAETWNEIEKFKKIEEYGGESSLGYRTFVKGEIVEEGISVFDMSRIRCHYLEDKIVKHFEIKKENYHNFKEIIVLEKPDSVEQVYIDADIGESAPTEIIIFFKTGKFYKYVSNITCYNLTDAQQVELFDWLIKTLQANVTGLDVTDGTGRAIYRALNTKYPKENLAYVSFNEKVDVDVEKDEKGQPVLDKNNQPVPKQEFISEWSVKVLKDLLYAGLVHIPVDYKFDKQLNSVIAIQTSQRISYQIAGNEDHLFAAFRVFAIAHWLNEFRVVQPVIVKTHAKSGV